MNLHPNPPGARNHDNGERPAPARRRVEDSIAGNFASQKDHVISDRAEGDRLGNEGSNAADLAG